jgi:hypothetical protein
MMATARVGAAVLALTLMLSPAAADRGGFGGTVTDRTVTRSLADQELNGVQLSEARVEIPSSAERATFRRWLYDEVGTIPDHRLRAEFYARYPRPGDFAGGFRAFVMADGERSLLGIDRFEVDPGERRAGRLALPALDASASALAMLRSGAAFPHLDTRNRDRLFRAPDGELVAGPDGQPLPFDPATLNTGARTGPTSDAHARLALPPGPKSRDPRVLDQRPWTFAAPFAFGDTVRTFVAENVALYTDLALLAALAPDRSGDGLALSFGGMALHYLASAANPMNALQVGSASIHEPSTLERWRRRARTLFGLLRREAPLGQEALDRAEAYRMAAGALVREAASRPLAEMPEPLRAGFTEGDAAFRAQLTRQVRAAGPADWPTALVTALASAAPAEGAEAFDIVLAVADRELRGTLPEELEELSDQLLLERFLPDRGASRNARSMARFWEIQGAAIGRLHAANQVWWAQTQNALEATAEAEAPVVPVLSRLVNRQLIYLAEADARRARFAVERPAGE